MAFMNLPNNILSLCSDKLVSQDIKGFLRFGAVCSSWRSVYNENRHRLPSQIPMLMLPTDDGEGSFSYSFYSNFAEFQKNLGGEATFRLPIPENVLECRGATHGWLVTIQDDFRVVLLNPFTLAEIKLPPLSTFDDATQGCPIENREFVNKVVLSSNPTSNPNFVAAAIFRSHSKLAFCMLEDVSWSSISHGNCCYSCEDIIHYRDQFYAVDRYGQIYSWDPNNRDLVMSMVGAPLEKECTFEIKRYLVEFSGDLLQVLRYIPPSPPSDDLFEVFKLDQLETTWNKVDTLDGGVLIVGDNSCVSVSSKDAADSALCGFKPNAIHFVDGYNIMFRYRYYNVWNIYNVGEYNIEDSESQCLLTAVKACTRSIKLYLPWDHPESSMPVSVWTECAIN